MASVLIVEADPRVRHLLVERFRREGYDIVGLRERLVMADLSHGDPELLVLELPPDTGEDLLSLLRAESNVPTIALLAPETHQHEVAALDAGADDVLRKPLALGDLMARSRAVLRRAGTVPSGALLDFGALVIDPSTRLVHTDSTGTIMLPHREFELLLHLASSPGQVFSREQLLEHAWGSSANWQGAATVTEHVYRLRRHLGPIGDCRIATVRSVGYRFTASRSSSRYEPPDAVPTPQRRRDDRSPAPPLANA